MSSTTAAEPAIIDLKLLETTDLHAHIMDYDYYSDASTTNYGLVRTAELINKHRAESKNTLLVDNGDTIQGNPLGEFISKNMATEQSPIIKAMNTLNYDAGTVGNHEFNYGLDFLANTTAGANFPFLNANVLNMDGSYYFEPYKIVDKVFIDKNGKEHTVKVGFTGFVTPQINIWDKKHLEGKVKTEDIVESAQKVIPEMKENGADLIIVLSHSGIETSSQPKGAENMVYDLALNVPNIDAIVSGHQHGIFPGDARFNNVDKIDNVNGTINGVPVVMAKNWGSHLGVIDMDLTNESGDWEVKSSKSTVESISTVTTRNTVIENAISQTHNSTVNYVRKPVGKTEAPINSFFALVKDDPSIQIVTDAQKWYAENAMKDTEYKDLPILSAGAPFKAGGRNGSDYYTNIPKGDLAIKNIGDLYLYDNTVQIVKLTGSQVKDWLEMSAGQFNTMNPSSSEKQPIINSEFPSYNFDVIDGVTYEIDLTQPPKYDTKGTIKNEAASRIKNLQFEGKAINSNQEFLVATNNYRASGGGNFPHMKPENIVFMAPDENRQALMQYILDKKTINPSADNNWAFTSINADVKATFMTSQKAKEFADDSVQFSEDAADGYAEYLVSFGDAQPVQPSDSWELTIMHTNDTHAHLDDVARRVTAVKDVRADAENSLLLDAGDVFSGDLYFTRWNGQADLEFMNMMGYDAMTLGNHEFDKGPSVLKEFIEKASFPIVSSNITFSKDKDLSGLVKEPMTFSQDTTNQPGIYPYILKEINGEKVAIFGLTTEDTVEASSPGKDVVFNSAVESARKTVDMITKQENVNKIIALTHLGYDRDLELAEAVEGIDIIVGGHSHTTVDQLKVVEADPTPTIVAQAKEYGEFLGRLDIVFDKNGLIIPSQSTSMLLPINEDVPEDPQAKIILDDYKAEIESFKNIVVGKTEVALNGERDDVRTKETNLGNLIADGMLAKAKETKGATLAITNGGGIRTSIDQGDITLGEVLEVMPFGNTLFVLDLTGEQIVRALENGVKEVESVKGAFPQVAGMKYSFSSSRQPGERILNVTVQNEDGTYSPIDSGKTYRVATNGFMGSGGDGYDVFTEASYAEDLYIVDYDVFTEYLTENGPVNPKVEGRITHVFEPTITIDEDNKANVTFDETFESYLQHTNEVIVDLSKAVDANETEIHLTKEQIQLLKNHKNPYITLYNGKVGMKLPLSNLEELDTVINMARTEAIQGALTDVYDFTITQDEKAVTTFKDQVTLMFAYVAENETTPSVYFVNRENAEYTKVEGSYEANIVYGSVDHFSEYTVMEDKEIAVPEEQEKELPVSGDGGNTSGNNGLSLPDTATGMYNLLLIGLLLLIVGLSVYIYQRFKMYKQA
ncbi:bifunctional 2',3'-cyclic-nucleotide 2'-phosphodiesterase/3'-nucleotidase [Metabacillus herbersteinensis]|uniref:Bifunctional 2',3'-cyclic-nucleotide 2'-phosphodiesterase/3'-nucleotidase n=1 Tax=Metabacillus herbersteinensis TaxID=283816 RepID=A0ABV6GGU0_9BACI